MDWNLVMPHLGTPFTSASALVYFVIGHTDDIYATERIITNPDLRMNFWLLELSEIEMVT